MINTIEIESTSRVNVQHTLYMDEQGKAIGCTCEARQFNSFKACRHMTTWNTTNTKEQRNSCILCGRDTKQVICGRCLE